MMAKQTPLPLSLSSLVATLNALKGREGFASIVHNKEPQRDTLPTTTSLQKIAPKIGSLN